jgi:hypothetical protein
MWPVRAESRGGDVIRFLVIAAFLASVAALSSATELDDYIAHIREYAMSGDAEASLRTVAAYQLGHSTISFRPDESSARYWASYSSLSCPNPDASEDETAAWREKLSAESNAYILKVRSVVDTDESGFVSDVEANAFRSTIELGILAAQLSSKGDLTLELLASACGRSIEDVQDLLREYRRLRTECEALGLVKPALLGGMPKVSLNR